MDNIELMSFKIIAAVGEARSMYIEAINDAKNGNFIEAKKKLADGEKIFIVGHHEHSNLLSSMANGEKIEPSILLIHAEDQLMTADAFKVIAQEFIYLYERISL